MHWHTILHVIWELFDWPAGIVVGNLLANVIWETPSQFIHNIRQSKHSKNIINHINKVAGNE